jgi:hypothetical protein
MAMASGTDTGGVEAPAIRNDLDKLVKDRRRQHQSRVRILELIQKERSDRHMFRHGRM